MTMTPQQLLNTVSLASLAIAGTVASAGAAQAAPTRIDLDSNLLNLFNQQFVPAEGVAVANPEFKKVDASKLWFSKAADNLDVFFINEGAAFRNQLLYSINNGSLNFIFSDVSSPDSVVPETDGPLDLGEGRRLDGVAKGSKLSFTLFADTADAADNRDSRSAEDASDREKYRYSTDETNPDKLQHVLAYQYQDYLVFSFEDLYGPLGAIGPDPNNPGYFFENSDRDFNDVVIAVRGVTTNEAEAVPEPGVLLGLGGAAAVAGLQALRRKVLGV